MADPNEILPFCMRCHGVGAKCDAEYSFCHQCGSEGTCIPMKRGDVEYLRETINARMSESNALIPVINVIGYLAAFSNLLSESEDPNLDERTVAIGQHILRLVIETLEDYRRGKRMPLEDDIKTYEQDQDNRYEGIL